MNLLTSNSAPVIGRTPEQDDFAFMMRFVPAEEQNRIRGRLKLVSLMATRPGEAAYKLAAAPIAEAHGLKSFRWKTAYKWMQGFDPKHPYTSLLDDRVRRRITADGLATNKQFVSFFQELCLRNKRCTEQAINELHHRFAAGESIPGIGTWQDVFALEHGGIRPPPDMACPYQNGIRMPKGLSSRNLRRLKPGRFITDALRKGNMVAAMDNLPDVLRTRKGLSSCQVIQIDDMWYEQKVAFKGNKHAERVVEYSAIDVLTGHVFARLMKPVIESAEGLKVLKSKWTRYLIAYTLCEVGIPEGGCVFQGEHGTATLDQDTINMLHELSGGTIRFTAGGLIDKPLVAGLDKCRPKGNPKFKGFLEGFHALIKNVLGSAPGQMGGGRGREPEWVYGMAQRDEAMRRWCEVAEKSRPGITDRLRFPFPLFADFAWIVANAYEQIDRSIVHDLSDWEDCGFQKFVWRANVNSLDWEPESKLRAYPAEVQALMDVTFKNNPKLVKFVRMSRLEAWDCRAADRGWKLDPSVAIAVMGLQLAQNCYCNKKYQLRFRDPETLTDETISGLLEGGGLLEPDQDYLVWLNPCSMRAYVADLQGRFIGCAKVVQKASYADDEAVKEQLGIRQKVLSQEVANAMPALRRIQAQTAADLAHNLTVMTGSDPAHNQALEEAAGYELNSVTAPALSDVLADEEAVPSDGPSDDELVNL